MHIAIAFENEIHVHVQYCLHASFVIKKAQAQAQQTVLSTSVTRKVVIIQK